MILPNDSNGKYVKVVIGIFVLFSIISPIINKFKGSSSSEIEIDKYVESSSKNVIQTSNKKYDNEETIKKIYEENLKIDIKYKITQKG